MIIKKGIARVKQASEDDYEKCLASMEQGTNAWKSYPIPKRGEIA